METIFIVMVFTSEYSLKPQSPLKTDNRKRDPRCSASNHDSGSVAAAVFTLLEAPPRRRNIASSPQIKALQRLSNFGG